MTPQELEQIRALLREEVSASEERVREEIAAVERRLNEKLDRAVESMVANISDVRSEMVSRFEALGRHDQLADMRMDRIETLVSSMNLQLTGLDKSIGDGQRLTNQMIGAQISEQKIIGELTVRLRAIEQKLAS
jgi:hypothetical protein